MNQLRVRHDLPSFLLGERRRIERTRDIHVLVVTSLGTGKIVDIHGEGLSFGCLYPHKFPEIFTIDILNARGLHLKRMLVRRVWQRFRDDDQLSEEFEMEVGAEFLALLPAQKALLTHLLTGHPAVDELFS